MVVPASVWLSRASFLLVSGSALLLLGAIAFARAEAIGGVLLLTTTWFVVILHGLGWYVLYEGVPPESNGRAIHALGGSAVLFLVGLVAMAALAPPSWTLRSSRSRTCRSSSDPSSSSTRAFSSPPPQAYRRETGGP